ncbi:MAG TPA: hypothetical protein VGS22_28925 [Thermoanaerobaculia bacterium]|jgi:hypothetical protein|nr:hypothetical protein [Thermoanaerobaculia bacterium]
MSTPRTLFPQPNHPTPGSGQLPSGRLVLGRRAAAAGDFDIAAFAFVRAANDYRLRQQPIFEVITLVELAAIYQLQERLERLPALVRRMQKIEEHGSLLPDQVAIALLAIELIENASEDPSGLRVFRDCWPDDTMPGERSQS